MSRPTNSPSADQKLAAIRDDEHPLFHDTDASGPSDCEPDASRIDAEADDVPTLWKARQESNDDDACGPLFFSDESDALDLRMDDLESELKGPPLSTESRSAHAAGVGVIDDHSAAEDVILERASAETPELKRHQANPGIAASHEHAGLISGRAGSRPTPRRIGDGRLVPARLNWKPGDPFASDSRPKTIRFRWEVMLTAACGTAICGMGAIWLLRMVVS